MGNQCCTDQSVQSTQIIQSRATPKSNQIQQSQHKISYIDSQGNPLPNAYKRYVKPPTTVGRQSLIVRNLHQNDEVPDWIWAFDRNILSSNHNKGPSKVLQNQQNRKTYQPIQGHFKGVQTINLSKLHFQQKNMTTSHNFNAFNNANLQNQNKMRYTVQPAALQHNFYQSEKPILHNQPISTQVFNPNEQIRRTFSAQEVPIITSVNASQNFVHNSPISTNLVHINSNLVSVNNSAQHSPARQINSIRY